MTVMQRIRYLLRPTCEWGPAGRMVTFTTGASSETPQRYDSVANTMVLINGVPMDEDREGVRLGKGRAESRVTMVVLNGGGSGDEDDERLQL